MAVLAAFASAEDAVTFKLVKPAADGAKTAVTGEKVPSVTLAAEKPSVGEEEDGSSLAEHDENVANAALIDAAFERVADDQHGEDEAPAEVPNNYRAPPKQNQEPRGPRERPNIFDHALLKSMDLSFVGNNFSQPVASRFGQQA